LAHASKIGMVELRLGSIACNEGAEQRRHGVERHRMPIREFLQQASSVGREFALWRSPGMTERKQL